MSLKSLLATLDITPRLAVIAIGERHLSLGDPKTKEGRLSLMENLTVLPDPLVIEIPDDPDTLSDDLRFADVLLAQAAKWLISVDETGEAFLPASSDGLFFDTTCHTGSWMDAEQESFLETELSPKDIPLFLYKGVLFGENIFVSLREIYTQQIFQHSWINPVNNATLLGAHPLLAAVVAKVIRDIDVTPEARDYITGSFSVVWQKTYANTAKDAAGSLQRTIDWIRDSSFSHGETRSAALWQNKTEENIKSLVALLPQTKSEWRSFVDDSTDNKSGHDVMAQAKAFLTCQHYLTTAVS